MKRAIKRMAQRPPIDPAKTATKPISSLYRWINPSFIGSFTHADQIPTPRDAGGKAIQEIALIGRSNAGKSSLINALLNIKQLAKSSKTPGKTRTHNLFVINSWISLMDLPGYGYAKVSHSERGDWDTAIPIYFETRKTLKGALLVIDSRREFAEEEIHILEMAAYFKVMHIDIVFTKCDKLSTNELAKCTSLMTKAVASLKKNIPALSSLAIQLHFVSSSTGLGIHELKESLIKKYSKPI
jgi:GTP-binding protein